MEGLDRFFPIVYLAVASAIMLPLLGPGYYIVLDMQFGPQSFSDQNFADFYGNAPSSYGAYFPLKMCMAAFSAVLGVEAVEKLLLLSILFLCGVSLHASLPKELGSARFFGGLLYMLNPFVFVRFLAGHWTLLLSYALWPFAILAFRDFLEKPGDRMRLAKAAILTSFAAISSHGVILLMIAYSFFLLAHILKKGATLDFTKRVAGLAAIVLLMNLYWIAPTIMQFGETYKPASSEAYMEDFGPQSSGLPIGASLATMHGFWRGGFTFTKDVFSLWPLAFLLIAILVICGFTVHLKEKAFDALVYLGIFFLALLLALGPESPIYGLMEALGTILPVQLLFRDTQKFVGLICLSYSVLGSYGAYGLAKEAGRLRPFLLIAIILLPIAYDYGFFGFLGQVGPTTYPADWAEAERIMSSDPVEGSLLVLPPYLYNYYPWLNATQKISGPPAMHFFSRPVVCDRAILTENVFSDINDPQGEYIRFLFDERQYIDDTAELLMPMGVRYILLPRYYEDSDYYQWLFDRMGGVENISVAYESDSMFLFRNDAVEGHLSSTDMSGEGDLWSLLNSTGKGHISPEASYRKITPAAYEINGSGMTYVLLPSQASGHVLFEGEPLSPWHGFASYFRYTGPGRLENTLFPPLLALFLLAWGIGIVLVIGLDLRLAGLLAFTAIALFFLISGGTLRPIHIGVLLLVTAFSVLAVSNRDIVRKVFTSFINIR
ncbi:MAG: hypothetical protein V1827_01210 [Candidatus Micrarchaeota archaeon]